MAMAAATATVVGAELPSGSRSERSLRTPRGEGVMSVIGWSLVAVVWDRDRVLACRVADRRAAASSATSSSACSCSRPWSSSLTWSRTAP